VLYQLSYSLWLTILIFWLQESANLLIQSGADPNLVNRVLKTCPIHVAARKGNLQILQLVILTIGVRFDKFLASSNAFDEKYFFFFIEVS
jgi:hypothetical protein